MAIIDLRGNTQNSEILARMLMQQEQQKQEKAEAAFRQQQFAAQLRQQQEVLRQQQFENAQVEGPQLAQQQHMENMVAQAAAPIVQAWNPLSGQFIGPVPTAEEAKATLPQAARDYVQLKDSGVSQERLRAAVSGPDVRGANAGQAGLYGQAQAEIAQRGVARLRTEYLAGVDKMPGLTPELRANARAQAEMIFRAGDLGFDSKEKLDLLLPNRIAQDFVVMQKTVAELDGLQNEKNADAAATPWLKAMKPSAFGKAGDVIPGAAKIAMQFAEIDYRAAAERYTAELNAGANKLVSVAEGVKHFQAQLAKKIGDAMEVVDPLSGAMGLRPRMSVEQAHAETVEEFRRSGYFGIAPGLEAAVVNANLRTRQIEESALPAVTVMVQSRPNATPQELEQEMVAAGWAVPAARKLIQRAKSAPHPKQGVSRTTPASPKVGIQRKPGSQLFGGGRPQ